MEGSRVLHKGSCLCGAVSFEIDGQFDSFYLCHCRYCQKDTGSAHAANLFAPTANIRWLQGGDEVQTFTLPGTRHSKSFCRHCGSALPNASMDSVLVVPAGCLDSDASLAPTAHIFASRTASWKADADRAPKYAELPDFNGA